MGQNIGALWAKKAKSNKKYLSGHINWKGEKIKIVVFVNEKKKEDNHPDYNILLNTPKGQG